MHDLTFWEAVGLWCDGQKLENFTMYGLSMLWWARIGKYLQFLGGVVVVLDLVGPARIEKASEWVRSQARHARVLLRSAAEVFLASRLVESTVKSVMGFANLVALIAAGVAFSVVGYDYFLLAGDQARVDDHWLYRISYFVFMAAVVVFMSVVVVVLALLASVILVPAILRIVSCVVALGRHGYIAQWVAVALVAAGFHLDLLGS